MDLHMCDTGRASGPPNAVCSRIWIVRKQDVCADAKLIHEIGEGREEGTWGDFWTPGTSSIDVPVL